MDIQPIQSMKDRQTKYHKFPDLTTQYNKRIKAKTKDIKVSNRVMAYMPHEITGKQTGKFARQYFGPYFEITV